MKKIIIDFFAVLAYNPVLKYKSLKGAQMKRTTFILTALIICAMLSVSGCGSAQKRLSEDVKGIKTKIDTLETRVEGVEAKQAEVERMTAEQAQRSEEIRSEGRTAGRSNLGIKHRKSPQDRERIKDIQTCLKNAGFYKGEVDGVKGRKTRSAIRKFQSANGLSADGVVGAKTWEALSKYSAGGSGAAKSAVEEEATAK
jgi:outer membrane murein-binding lipoprotein Lpp